MWFPPCERRVIVIIAAVTCGPIGTKVPTLAVSCQLIGETCLKSPDAGPGRPWRGTSTVLQYLPMPIDSKAPLRDAVRDFNKHVLNPLLLHVAGRKHFYASVIRHTGRITGKQYATPVVANGIADGYLIPLPYGTGVDWLRNVLAAKRASVTSGGETHDVTDPQVLDARDVIGQLPVQRQRVYARLGIDKFLKVSAAQQS